MFYKRLHVFSQASTNLLTVNLFVLPYNYPMLLPLLDDLFKVHRLKPTNEWRTQFHNYLRTMPPYYAGMFSFIETICKFSP